MTNDDFGGGASRLAGAAALLLGWRPREFWESTPAELAAALRADEATGGPEPAEVAALMRRFPDE